MPSGIGPNGERENTWESLYAARSYERRTVVMQMTPDDEAGHEIDAGLFHTASSSRRFARQGRRSLEKQLNRHI